MLRCDRKQQNSVKQLSFNSKINKLKKKRRKEKKIKQLIQKMGGRPKHMFFQRRYTDDQQMHDKMLNITHY